MEKNSNINNLKLYSSKFPSDFNILLYSDSAINNSITEKCIENKFNLYKIESLTKPNELILRLFKEKSLNFSILI